MEKLNLKERSGRESARKYFRKALRASISSLPPLDFLTNEHFNPSKECSMASYFKDWIRDGRLYDSVDEFSDRTLLIESDDMKEASEMFEQIRQQEVTARLEQLFDGIVSLNEIEYKGRISYSDVCKKAEKVAREAGSTNDVTIDYGDIAVTVKIENCEGFYVDGIKWIMYKGRGCKMVYGKDQPISDEGGINWLLKKGYTVDEIAVVLGYTILVLVNNERSDRTRYYFERS